MRLVNLIITSVCLVLLVAALFMIAENKQGLERVIATADSMRTTLASQENCCQVALKNIELANSNIEAETKAVDAVKSSVGVLSAKINRLTSDTKALGADVKKLLEDKKK